MRLIHPFLVSCVHPCAAAFRFLTRLPVPGTIVYDDALYRRSVVFYPAAGAAIGLLLVLAASLLRLGFPAFPSAAVLLALWVCATGGLHLDGLMDAADGLLSYRPRERMLEIMKDSRVGAMGVIACVLQLLLKLSLLYALFDPFRPMLAALLLCVPVWSRWFMAAAMAGWPYARQGEGFGAAYSGVKTRHMLLALLAAACLTLAALTLAGFGLAAAAASAACFLAAAGLPGRLLASRINRRLGGLTGDTYGALNELLETLLLAGVVSAGPWLAAIGQ